MNTRMAAARGELFGDGAKKVEQIRRYDCPVCLRAVCGGVGIRWLAFVTGDPVTGCCELRQPLIRARRNVLFSETFRL
jgi:hypothetical protein